MAKMSIEEMKWVLKKMFDYSKRIQEKRNRVGEMTQLENSKALYSKPFYQKLD